MVAIFVVATIVFAVAIEYLRASACEKTADSAERQPDKSLKLGNQVQAGSTEER